MIRSPEEDAAGIEGEVLPRMTTNTVKVGALAIFKGRRSRVRGRGSDLIASNVTLSAVKRAWPELPLSAPPHQGLPSPSEGGASE